MIMRAILTPIVVVATFMLLFPAALIVFLIKGSENCIHKIGKLWAKIIIKTAGIKIDVTGQDNIPLERPVVFACNHASQFDIPILYEVLPVQFRFLAKKELFKIPFLGFAMRFAGYIPVNRSGGKAAMLDLKKAAERLKTGVSIVIFPEGTRSTDGQLKTFKMGGIFIAFKAGCPLVPIAISGSHYILPKGSLRVKPGRVKVTIGPPIQTTSSEGTLPKNSVTKELWNSISAMLKNVNNP
jgi:1-acyl-sn-glycerol-3-phosphate acyltransferase